jgi:hypothetical protein
MGNCFSNLPQDATCTEITDTCTSSSLGGFKAEMAEVVLRVHDEATEEHRKNNPDAWKNMRYDEYRRCWVEVIVAGADGGVGDSATCADAGDGVGAVGACWDCAGCGGGDSVGADAPWDCAGTSAGCGGAFSAVGASCDTDGVGAVSIKDKAGKRKDICDLYFRGIIIDPLLKAIGSGENTPHNIKLLLEAWHDPKTPHVLMCLIADIFHKHEREEELGKLPSYYILPHKQEKGKGRGKKSKETVDCTICRNRRGGGCKCCTTCSNRTGSCTCKKECDECSNNLCDCICPV